MRVYYDTEFIERPGSIDLVSIGMVAEDGRELYAISSEFDQRALLSNEWLAANVWSSLPTTEPKQYRDGLPAHGHLDTDHPDVRSRAQIERMVRDFVLQTPEVELWAYYADYDHVVMCWLFGRMIDLPDGFPMWTNDLRQEIHRLGLKPSDMPKQADGHHNALADARHNLAMGEYLKQAERERAA